MLQHQRSKTVGGPTRNEALFAFIASLVLAALLGILIVLTNSCASTDQALGATEKADLALHSQMRSVLKARCLEIAQHCTVPADKCEPLQKCQAVRRYVDDGVVCVLMSIGRAQEAIRTDSMHDVAVYLQAAKDCWQHTQTAYDNYAAGDQ